MSDLLRRFLTEWLHYAETGENRYGFNYAGLCSEAYWYMRRETGTSSRALQDMLTDMFREDGMHGDYPFNRDQMEYCREDHTRNPRRLAWVRSKLGYYDA